MGSASGTSTDHAADRPCSGMVLACHRTQTTHAAGVNAPPASASTISERQKTLKMGGAPAMNGSAKKACSATQQRRRMRAIPARFAGNME